jgi:hypothetical protein
MDFDPRNFDWTKMFGFITQIIEMFCPEDPNESAKQIANMPIIRKLFEGMALRDMGYRRGQMRKARDFIDPILTAEIEVATHEELVAFATGGIDALLAVQEANAAEPTPIAELVQLMKPNRSRTGSKRKKTKRTSRRKPAKKKALKKL